MSRTETARALRQAQRTHTPVHAELRGGSSADGTPHSVCHASAWLLTAGPDPADLFVRLAAILDVRPF